MAALAAAGSFQDRPEGLGLLRQVGRDARRQFADTRRIGFAAFGDFQRGYLIVDRAGVRVLRDPYSAKPYVLFYTTKRVGGGVQNFDAIKVMKFAAT